MASLFVIGYILFIMISHGFYPIFDDIKSEGVTSHLETIISTTYPIMDLSLIIPSIFILVNLYHDYQHSIPWVLASLYLLLNAIADNGNAMNL